MNPWLVRALTTTTHNLLADSLWLMSNKVSEIMKDFSDFDEEEFIQVSNSIRTMDPYSYKINNYANTLLVANYDRIDFALEALHFSRYWDQNNFLLYFDEIMFLMTYCDAPLDYNYLRKLTKQAAVLPDAQKKVGGIIVVDYMEDLLLETNRKLFKKEQMMLDLQWLLNQTTSPKRKQEILKRIKSVENAL